MFAIGDQADANRAGQVLWEHASRWVSDRPVAADLVRCLAVHARPARSHTEPSPSPAQEPSPR